MVISSVNKETRGSNEVSTQRDSEMPAETKPVHDVLRDADLDRSVLVRGPAMTGKQQLGAELLGGQRPGEGWPIWVTTTDTAEQVRGSVASLAPDMAGEVLVIDCLAIPGTGGDERGYSASSPGDLTGIAMAISKAYEDCPPDRQGSSRVLLDSISPMLMYADVEPVYRFLHTLVNRVEERGGVVIATLDTDCLDEANRRTLGQLFDTHLQVRDADDGPEYRVRGRPDVPETWFRMPDTRGGNA